jgi:hypothetical protein
VSVATYAELFDLGSNSALKNKVAVCILVAADTIRTEDGGTANHVNRLLWAKDAFLNPLKYVQPMWDAALAQNKSLSTAQISGASDANLQTAIDAVVNIFATGS